MEHLFIVYRARWFQVRLSSCLRIQLIIDRTDWAGRSMKFPEKRHPAYDHLNAEKSMGERNGTQVGDVNKAAKAMYKFAVMDDPPLRVVIGSDAYKAIFDKLDKYQKNYKKYEELSNSTDVDE